MSGPRSAVFLDRDGTVLDELGYLADPDRVRYLPGALEALARLASTGLPLVVITNQSGIARGLLDEPTLAAIHARIRRDAEAAGAHLSAFYHCPHHPDLGPPSLRLACDCRKPKPGLFLRAARDHDLALAASFAVGDTLRDLEAAHAAGVGTLLLVRTGKGEATEHDAAARLAELGVRVEDDLAAATARIEAELAARPPQGR